MSWLPGGCVSDSLIEATGGPTSNNDLRLEFCLFEPLDSLSQLSVAALGGHITCMDQNIA